MKPLEYWLIFLVEYWMEKFEVDTDAKSAELTQLKADKEKDLRTLQELARTYDDYEVMGGQPDDNNFKCCRYNVFNRNLACGH